ncbi:MAG TPA: efflux RND transporter periplasmic adaptor subunit [Sphingomonas sp.]|uniref:efflux RND transporter periplasmic adaptor subunit n=1 Tax=Sphingomonas sp. TaxID=28214 RepID=UPI002C0E5CCD|nr:efflux RND transporter periplasmic adaptor subunit [Sphingomonas sp.]HMI21222.1 efflux RND transporter periplasmic adaptor subunit [Sphingomonas sp.]
MNDELDAPLEPVERSPNSRRNALIVVVVLIVIASLAWVLTRSGSSDTAGGAGGGRGGGRRAAATVGVAKVVAADMPQSLSAIGTVQPIVTATVRPQLSGNVFTINFREGQVVAKGQLLAQIDPRPYRLALAQAEANLTRDESQLNLARVDLHRYQVLLAQDSIARQQVDTQAATVKQQEGVAAADRAAIGTAKLNLRYTSITAPVSGRIGLRQADIGNYVSPGDATGIAVITQTDPIDVSFAVPQGNLPGILARRATGAALPVTATDQGGQNVLAHGSFLTFDNQIDTTTGTVKAKARFPNPGGILFPNQFVNVSLLVDTLKGAATIPVTAVRHGTQGDFVFVLQADHTVKMQTVTQGPANGSNVAILSGLALGQTVITEGADNLEDGSKVVLPGEKPAFQRKKKAGLFSWLFGSGSGGGEGNRQSAENASDAGSDNASGNASGAKHGGHRRHQQGGGNSQ